MHKYIFVLLFLSSSVVAQEKSDILETYNQFVISGAAAKQCVQPDAETMAAFMANFYVVFTGAFQEQQKQNPKLSQGELYGAMDDQSLAMSAKMEALIAKKGCSDPEVKMAVERFFKQVKWKPDL